MRQIRLKPEYLPLIACGLKRSTVRAGRSGVMPGPAEIVAGSERVPVEITGVAIKRLGELEDADARIDGFDTLASLAEALRRFYPHLSDEDDVSIIYFEPRASSS